MAYRILTSLKTVEVHSNSIVKARAKAAEHVSKHGDTACDVLNGLKKPWNKSLAGRAIRDYGRLYWLTAKNQKFIAEYELNKDGTLGRLIRRF